MTGVPRSQRLLALHSVAGASSASFVCPDGTVTLVKSASFYNNTGAALPTVELALNTGDNAVPIYLVATSLAANTGSEWNGWQVLNPGDYVLANASPGADIWVSGAILMGAPQFPPAGGH